MAMAPSRQRSDMTVRNASVQSGWTNPRTTARGHLAYAIVDPVGNEHVAARIDGHANWKVEAGIGPGSVRKRRSAHPRERCNPCPLNNRTTTHITVAAYLRTPTHKTTIIVIIAHKFDSVEHINAEKELSLHAGQNKWTESGRGEH
jgi:hypothetical protein